MNGKTARNARSHRVARIKHWRFQCQIASGWSMDRSRIIISQRISTAC